MSQRISRRVLGIVRMTMADMANLADRNLGTIRLENADTDLPPAPHVIEATRGAIGVDRYNSYLPLRGLPDLRRAIAQRYRIDQNLKYDPEEEIVVTSGAGESMLNSLLSLVDPKDRVLLTNPTYSGMAQRVRLADGIQVFSNLIEEKGWHLDMENLPAMAKGCKAIFYASPCMPTGTVFTREETKCIVEVAEENDAIIIFNASMDKVVYDNNTVTHPAKLRKGKGRTITIGSVTKNYSMIAWRVGWTVGPRELVKPIENVHIFNGIMPSGFSQAGAVSALKGPQAWLEKTVKLYQRRRDIMLDNLSTIGGIGLTKPEGGYSFLANISHLGVKSPEFCVKLMREKNVATTPMVAWGSDDFGYDHVRFIFTNEPEERLKSAGALIREFVRENFNSNS